MPQVGYEGTFKGKWRMADGPLAFLNLPEFATLLLLGCDIVDFTSIL
jgi:hypothetical protein